MSEPCQAEFGSGWKLVDLLLKSEYTSCMQISSKVARLIIIFNSTTFLELRKEHYSEENIINGRL